MAGWFILQIKLLGCAIQFLTRIPTPTISGFQDNWITRSARYFPLVGQLVGAVSALALMAAGSIWGVWVGAIVAIGAGVLLTGAFHEDGLADTADGLGGGQTPERRLEIMKDSRLGTYGATALILVLALKVALLAHLPLWQAALALFTAHGVARAAAVVAMRLTPYAPSGAAGKWKPTPSGVRTSEACVALLVGLWPLLLAPTIGAGLGILVGGSLAVAVCLAARALIGGHTGDVLGAVEQVFEVGFLLGVAAVLK